MSPSSTSSSKELKREGPDGLIAVSDGAFVGPLRRQVGIAIVAVFLLILTATGVIDTIAPAARPALTGGEAKVDRERRSNAQFADGTLASLFEYDRRLTSSVRRAVLPHYARALYSWFGFAKLDAVVGTDGWMFLRSRVESNESESGRSVVRAASRLAALDRVLATRGTELVIAPIPRKSALYQDRLPIGSDSNPELDERFVEALADRALVVAPILRRFKEYLETPEARTEPLYYKLGTHWTPLAEALAAEEIATASGRLVPKEERETKVVIRGSRLGERALLSLVGIDESIGKGLWSIDPESVINLLVVGPGGDLSVFRENPKRVGQLALVGTSFSTDRQFPFFLSNMLPSQIYNAARPAISPIDSLLELLSQSEPGRPELIVCELPGHFAFINDDLTDITDVFNAVDLSWTQPLGLDDHWQIDSKVKSGLPLQVGWNSALATLAAGNLAHDGGGLLAVRLRGAVQAAPIRILMECGSEKGTIVWPEGRSEVFLPLMEASVESAAVTLVAKLTDSPATLTLDPNGIEVVGIFDYANAWLGEVQASERGSTLVDFNSSEKLPPRAALILKLSSREPIAQLSLDIETDGQWHAVSEFRELNAGATLCASLSSYSNRTVTRVRINGVTTDQIREIRIDPLTESGTD